eukprot:CAMPEP_0202699612 /NCGR_PEP_ID=MMETSP1385-20130828/12838_1 /ASSEMBLY_ACC=CAM_ASM_000861 /TAXON_ID=933848 /ORGANISM="Elphidium margaritaceum" /LENGTH=574 /DNA_ID=CAMNT_0049356591 /DNA_START=94 /DNA_END=1818 /DNA_ORIENTATION=-
MIIYLSLKQLLLNQIAVLIRKQNEKNNDDPERTAKRLSHLQLALEQIKSYEHNETYQYVIKHFDVFLSDDEQKEMAQIARRFEDTGFNNSNNHNNNRSNNKRRISKSGFTTTRSETLFTGAAEEHVDHLIAERDLEEDEKHDDPHNDDDDDDASPHWIHYKGFRQWLKKQSFIKFVKRNDEEKYRKIWNNLLALHFIQAWDKGKIKHKNIVGSYGTSTPYNDIHKCGNKDVVKSSLLRMSMTQNRIFRFKIEKETKTESGHRARGSIDMDREEKNKRNTASAAAANNANLFLQGRSLFDEVTNKDTLRIVATLLWEKDLANNVLEELLHNPRFSMYGIHAKNIADKIAKEFNLDAQQRSVSVDVDDETAAAGGVAGGVGGGNDSGVDQFALPSPQKPVPMQKAKQISRQQQYEEEADEAQIEQHHGLNTATTTTTTTATASNAPQANYGNSNQWQRYQQQQQQLQQETAKYAGYKSTPEPTPEEEQYAAAQKRQLQQQQQQQQQQQLQQQQEQQQQQQQQYEENPSHRGHSGSVVFHDNIRDSEIMGAADDSDSEHGDDDEDDYGGDYVQQQSH